MDSAFHTIIEDFIANNIGVCELFLPVPLALELKKNLLDLIDNDALKLAGVGNDIAITKNKLLRNDKIYWLDTAHGNLFENKFLAIMDAFVVYLNTTCYTGITGYEFHYTLYPSGSFYRKHKDQFQNNDSRQFSMIFYLNTAWKSGDGGELCVYHDAATQLITPTNGKAVFFRSNELAHEVLETLVPRMSITGWFKRDAL